MNSRPENQICAIGVTTGKSEMQKKPLTLQIISSRMLSIITPTTSAEMEEYYNLRWSLLRRPWGGKRGSELDDLESVSFHRAALLDAQIIAVGRIHFIDKVAQIRYMAVKNRFSRKGVGSSIVSELEKIAIERNVKDVFLNARVNAIQFYEKNGYTKISKSEFGFGSILHYRMEKVLEKL